MYLIPYRADKAVKKLCGKTFRSWVSAMSCRGSVGVVATTEHQTCVLGISLLLLILILIVIVDFKA